MPTHAKSHDECRKCVCLLCFNKTKTMRNITKTAHKIIQEHIVSGYDESDDRLPTMLCSNCYTIIYEYNAANFTHVIPIFDYSSLKQNLRPNTRNAIQCDCKVCEIARSSTTSNFSPTVIQKRKPGPVKQNVASHSLDVLECPPSALKICSKCLTFLSRGKPHVCTETQRHENLMKLTSKPESKCGEKLVTSIVREKIKSLPSSENLYSFTAPTGRPLIISTCLSNSQSTKSEYMVSTEDIHKIQSDMNLSTNQTKILSKHIRSSLGVRNAIEPHTREKLQVKSHVLDFLFNCEVKEFYNESVTHKDSPCVITTAPVVYCNNVEELKSVVISARNYIPTEIKTILGIDGGGGFLKLCLSLCNPTQPDLEHQENKRSKLSDGVAQKKLKDTSVKKLFILAIVQDLQENYHNVLTLWTLLQLTSSLYTFAIMDLKLANIMIGLMSHSCAHPCTWCNISKDRLDQKGELHTLGKIRTMFSSFIDSGSDRAKAKHYGNFIHTPIFNNTDDTLVLDIIPPPELHLLLGAVNHLFINLEKIWPDAIKWAASLNLEREAMHGGTFAGNSCRKLLKNVVKLELMAPPTCKLFISSFNAFDEVVKSCFGKHLHDDYLEKITNFQLIYQQLQISTTPKLHAIFFHIKDFCEANKQSLGVWSEQAFESVHSDFEITWSKYKVPSIHEKYGKHLLRAVQEYNGNHL